MESGKKQLRSKEEAEKLKKNRSYDLRERKGKRKAAEEEGKRSARGRRNPPPLLYEPLCGYKFRKLPDRFIGMKVNEAFNTTHRLQPWLPQVRDQEETEFCWSVGSTQLTQATTSFHGGPPDILSPQTIIDELPSHFKKDAINFKVLKEKHPGTEERERRHYPSSTFFALKFIQRRGIGLEVNHPYLGYFDGPKEFNPFARLDLRDIFHVPPRKWSAPFFRQILQSYGCLVGTFIADVDLINYKFPNVYSLEQKRTKELSDHLHCVLITGAGQKEDNEEFLEIQNSYGTGWGDKGFGYINLKLFVHIQGLHGVIQV